MYGVPWSVPLIGGSGGSGATGDGPPDNGGGGGAGGGAVLIGSDSSITLGGVITSRGGTGGGGVGYAREGGGAGSGGTVRLAGPSIIMMPGTPERQCHCTAPGSSPHLVSGLRALGLPRSRIRRQHC